MRIAHHRWSHALVAGLLLVGCKSSKDKEAAPPAQAPATPTASAAKPAAPAPAPTPAPVSDTTLSYLEPSADKKCRWVQHTPPGEPKVVFTVPSSCDSVQVAWKGDGKEALVSVPMEKGAQAWRVDLATGTGSPLSLPTPGNFGTLGFDAEGRAVALTEDPYYGEEEGAPSHLKVETVGKGEDAKKEFVFEGQRYEFALDGMPGLTHAFRQEGGAWKRFETKSSSFEWDYAAGYRALDAYDAMMPTAGKLESLSRDKVFPVPEDSAVLAELTALPPPSESGSWQQLETAGGLLYLWQDESTELAFLSGPVRMQGAKGLVEPEGLALSGALSAFVRGDWVLLTASDDAGKPVAKLWNARTKKLLASLSDKGTVTFWPKPSSSDTGAKAPVAGSPTP
ncbi:hypothetical protein JRI60_27515 [Archangium violaceum]|uniref:hypothetical protein n=1 Tax=Archangium violaceum TaxID=83451 RepID=UPI0019529C95|nr:hypothetical protein [Archangium violaceum]QRN92958.1 hypothetical protein JRI60_27515 [Archangium violaceum]